MLRVVGLVPVVLGADADGRHAATLNDVVAEGPVVALGQDASRASVAQAVADDLAGSSDGGHVAACTALISGLDEKGEDAEVPSIPHALVLFNPVIDTSPAGYGNARLGAR